MVWQDRSSIAGQGHSGTPRLRFAVRHKCRFHLGFSLGQGYPAELNADLIGAELLGCLRRSALVVLGARPGMGKTTLTMTARHVRRPGRPEGGHFLHGDEPAGPDPADSRRRVWGDLHRPIRGCSAAVQLLLGVAERGAGRGVLSYLPVWNDETCTQGT